MKNLGQIPHTKLLFFCRNNAITKHCAGKANHAIHAADAYERAVIFIRLLLGEKIWDDGYERKIDDCFEMGDGDEVCGWLLEFSEADSNIENLFANHQTLQNWPTIKTSWEKNRGLHLQRFKKYTPELVQTVKKIST